MSRRRRHPASERELDDLVCRALDADRRIVPVTPEQVAEAEESLLEPEASRLPSFDEVSGPRATDLKLVPRSIGTSPQVEETLARAAREGGYLSPEIEEAMHRDRDAAEEEADG